MKKSELIRAWKDPSYRANASEQTQHPAGIAELDDALLSKIGGATSNHCGGSGRPAPTVCQACFE